MTDFASYFERKNIKHETFIEIKYNRILSAKCENVLNLRKELFDKEIIVNMFKTINVYIAHAERYVFCHRVRYHLFVRAAFMMNRS